MGVYTFSSNFYIFLHFSVQFVVIICSYYVLTGEKLSFNRLLESVLFIIIPTFVLYVFSFWIGIIYFNIALILFFFLRFSKARRIIYITMILLVAIIADHSAVLLLKCFDIQNVIIKLIALNVLFGIIHFLFISFFKLVGQVFKTNIILSVKIRGLIISLLIITLIVFYYNIFLMFNEIDTIKVKTNLIAFFMLLIVHIFMIYYILLKEKSIRAKEFENKFFYDYIVSLEETNKKMQQFQHDYLNILLSLKGYIDSADWEGLQQYFEKDILNFERKTILENKAFGHLKNVNVMSLKGLLLVKSLRAIDENLNISIEVAEPINSVPIDTIDLNRILGNLIDNAIENCIEDGKEHIQIAIIKQNNSAILFRISNEIGDKEINVSQIFQKGFTTKQFGQGIGLYNVKNIVDKNPKLNINIWIEDGWFNAELIVLEGGVI